jgi:hypothetical protein
MLGVGYCKCAGHPQVPRMSSRRTPGCSIQVAINSASATVPAGVPGTGGVMVVLSFLCS